MADTKKYLDMAGLAKLVELIKEADSAILAKAQGAKTAAEDAQSSAEDAQSSANQALAALGDAYAKADYTKDGSEKPATVADDIAEIKDSLGLGGAGGSEGIATRVSTLEGTVGNASSGLVKDVADLKNNTTVSVEAATTASEGYLKTYEVKQGGVKVGTIDIPKDFLVKSGTVVNKTEDGEWGTAGTYIELVLNVKEGAAATDSKIYINVGSLIEYVTASNAEGANVIVTVDADTHKVSAALSSTIVTDIAAGKAASDYLTDDVKAKIENGNAAKSWIDNNGLGATDIQDYWNFLSGVEGATKPSWVD